MARKKQRYKQKRSRQIVKPLSASEVVKNHFENYDDYLEIEISTQCNYILNNFEIKLQDACNFPIAKILYLHFRADTPVCFLCWEEVKETKEDQVKFCYAKYEVPYDVLNALKYKKLFTLVLNSENTTNENLLINICIVPKLISPLIFASEQVSNYGSQSVQIVVEYFHKVSITAYEEGDISVEFDIEELYSGIQNTFNPSIKSDEVVHPFLVHKLREYQEQAVNWMLKSEKRCENPNRNELHTLYEELKTMDGFNIYYQKYNGIFVTQKFTSYPLCKGGILADEMGLGKTVEVLACILLHPRKDLDVCKQPDLSESEVSIVKDKPDSFPVSKTESIQLPRLSSKHLLEDKENGDNDRKKRHCNEMSLITSYCRKCGFQLDSSIEFTLYSCPMCSEYYVKNSSDSTNETEKLSMPEDDDLETSSQDSLECVCGKKYQRGKKLECQKCGLQQHAKCVLAEPAVSHTNYMCPYCWVDSTMKPVKSRATLIVSPSAILFQWSQEIERHIEKGKLKVFHYLGIEHHKFINPVDLADHDIVLSSYEILRRELSHVNVPHGETLRSLRNPKKFRTLPSPLSAVEWWRICLDEAQMVEGVASKTAQMALQLHCINRWCITGTPIQNSVEDLYGLILFLEFDPYNVKEWWNELISKPFANGNNDTLKFVLNSVLWRTSKSSVLDQINIPQQDTIIHKIQLSQVEKVFYDGMHARNLDDFIENVKKYDCEDVNLQFIDKQILSKILHPLKDLQKACSHFQLTGGRFADIQRKKMTIPELLDFLLTKAAYDAEEAQRKLILSLNGLAGMCSLRKLYRSSCEMYIKVLTFVEKNNIHIRTDILQKMHAYENYANNILNWANYIDDDMVCPLNNNSFINDPFGENLIEHEIKEFLGVEDIKSLVKDLRTKSKHFGFMYVQKFESDIESCVIALNEIHNEICEIISCFKCERMSLTTSMWWFEILESLNKHEKQLLVDKIKESLMTAPGSVFLSGRPSVSERFQHSSGLAHQLVFLSDALHETRSFAINAIKTIITNTPSVEEHDRAVACHLRPNPGRKANKCSYCMADIVLKQYQSKLFRYDEVVSCDDEPAMETTPLPELRPDLETTHFPKLRQGTNAVSEFQFILKEFVNYGRSCEGLTKCTEDGYNELKLFDALKKEFKILRNTWLKIYEYTCALDEVLMAKMPMRLLREGEKPPHPPVGNIVPHGQFSTYQRQLEYDMIANEAELKTKLGQLFYLQNLQKKPMNGTESMEQSCTVCLQAFEKTWSVLQCGHSFCNSCVVQVIKLSAGNGFRCPVCRAITTESGIYTAKADPVDPDEVFIKGKFSAKISSVVKCLMNIQKQDPTAKSLVFSTWPGLLQILAEALLLNKIHFIRINSKKSFEAKKIEKFDFFKQSSELNVLLIPLHMGANGLNIIEAMHVLLVEPVIDNSQTLQAIGRVHRIGQTKKTFVHKFVIESTIEEKIHQIYDTGISSNTHFAPVTVKDLMQLFNEE